MVNKLLIELKRRGFEVVAYADDVAIRISGKFPDTLKELMQNALNVMVNWAHSCGLEINAQKTELVLFTRKRVVPVMDPPSINGISLAFSEEAKFLGVILDRKLNWKSNITERVRKATVALYSCKNAIGKTWGLNPQMVHWLYICVIRPILMYGVIVWWPALKTAVNLKQLENIQR